MEHPSRLARLPAELIGELIYLQDWRDIMNNLSLPEYSRYRDPNHPVWRQLYHSRLSTYPLPAGSNYQQQYFWGSDVAEQLKPLTGWTSVEELKRILGTHHALPASGIVVLAELGYDVILFQLPLASIPGEHIDAALIAAAQHGYLSIVKHLYHRASGDSKEQALRRAIIGGHRDVVMYLIDRNPPDERHLWSLLGLAVKLGQLGIVDTLVEWAQQRNIRPNHTDFYMLLYTAALNVMGQNETIMIRIIDKIMTLVPDVTVIDYEPVNYEMLTKIAIGKGHADIAIYFILRGGIPIGQQLVDYAIQYNRRTPQLTRWLIENAEPGVTLPQQPIATLYSDDRFWSPPSSGRRNLDFDGDD